MNHLRRQKLQNVHLSTRLNNKQETRDKEVTIKADRNILLRLIVAYDASNT